MSHPAPIITLLLTLGFLWGCKPATSDGDVHDEVDRSSAPPILLVTLDTARADAFGFDSKGVVPSVTPNLDSIAREGVRFTNAYATAPMTLPSHVSMFTGRYPADHGVHENARNIHPEIPLLAERLTSAGYETAAFVSAVPLQAGLGLQRGFNLYDDDFGGQAERSALLTTDAALNFLDSQQSSASTTAAAPQFLWVHYFDPHAPYAGAQDDGQATGTLTLEQPSAQQTSPDKDHALGSLGKEVATRYLEEIATVDREASRLISRFRAVHGDQAHILIVADHGESLGEFGERTHGSLLHESVLRVPLLILGDPTFEAGTEIATPVSIRRVFGTILAWAADTDGAALQGNEPPPRFTASLYKDAELTSSFFDTDIGEIPLAEAMQPTLQYGWQPQVAGVDPRKAETLAWLQGDEQTGVSLTLISVATNTVNSNLSVSPDLRAALRNYPPPSQSDATDMAELSTEARAQLAALGYVTGSAVPKRKNAPRPSEMTDVLIPLERASAAFEARNFQRALQPLGQVLALDPGNFSAALRLAVAHSFLETGRADELFDRARSLAPESTDLRHFEGMHRLRLGDYPAAAALFESVLAADPERSNSLLGLYQSQRAQGDLDAATQSLRRYLEQSPEADRWADLGTLHFRRGQTQPAVAAFETARDLDPAGFEENLDLGVLYLADRQFEAARESLDLAIEQAQQLADRETLAMALFKRAQVSVLLGEPNADQLIRDAAAAATPTTRPLIENENLFRELPR